MLLIFVAFLTPQVFAQQARTPETSSPEINTTLMETTFKILGPSARAGEEGKTRLGTCFIIMRRLSPNSNYGVRVLVTARHVFEDIKGDTASVILRRRDPAGNITPFPFSIKIRDNGHNLYTAHPTADVAAIDVTLPPDSIIAGFRPNIATTNWLATDDFLTNIGIHPGDELFSLGYPFGDAANDAGYPILRSGAIASFPIIPLEKAGKILYDFHVYPGNSGGPVYFSYPGRLYKGKAQFGRLITYQKIFGLVTQKADDVGNIDPNIGIIVPSIYIKQTIDQLAGFETPIEEDQ